MISADVLAALTGVHRSEGTLAVRPARIRNHPRRSIRLADDQRSEQSEGVHWWLETSVPKQRSASVAKRQPNGLGSSISYLNGAAPESLESVLPTFCRHRPPSGSLPLAQVVRTESRQMSLPTNARTE